MSKEDPNQLSVLRSTGRETQLYCTLCEASKYTVVLSFYCAIFEQELKHLRWLTLDYFKVRRLFVVVFKKKLEDISPFYWATDARFGCM